MPIRKLIIPIFILLSISCWAQSIFSKTPIRLKISTNSKSDIPVQLILRGKDFEKNISFFEFKEITIELPDRGNYEVVLIWKSGFTEKRTVNATQENFSIEFVSNPNVSERAINVTAKNRKLLQTIR